MKDEKFYQISEFQLKYIKNAKDAALKIKLILPEG